MWRKNLKVLGSSNIDVVKNVTSSSDLFQGRTQTISHNEARIAGKQIVTEPHVKLVL